MAGPYAADSFVVECPGCQQKLRVQRHRAASVEVVCPRCGCALFSLPAPNKSHRSAHSVAHAVAATLLLVAIVAEPWLAWGYLNGVTDRNEQAGERAEQHHQREMRDLQQEHLRQLSTIDIDTLRKAAAGYYAKEWEERNNFNARYALSPREKSQLKMRALARDRTTRVEDIVKEIAALAAPQGSSIQVSSTARGMRLDIDFQMSAVTHGEQGTRTKHETVESLKNEVRKLISRVTHDVYAHCQVIDLESIHIGCKHLVTVTDEKGRSKDENIVLYKIHIARSDIGEMKRDPWLDTASIAQYFVVELDDFPNLTISVTRQ